MENIRILLEKKLMKIETDMARLTAPPKDTGGISFGKRVGEGTSLAVDRLQDVAAHDKSQAVLADVTRALEKLKEGTYGECDNCHTSVGDARLEALPWATHCVSCASRT